MAFDLPPVPTPTPAVCARPNVAATTLHAAPVVIPPVAEQHGIAGTVQVIVSLAADSRVTAVRIYQSPSAMLNEAALDAARASTFQTEIRSCRPLAADYIYSVDFQANYSLFTAPSGDMGLTITAKGTVTRAADSAIVLACITTRDDVAANATAQNDAMLDALEAKLRAVGIGDALVRTTKFTTAATPPPEPRRYWAEREVEVTVNAVANAAKVAAVVATSAALVDRTVILFTLSDRPGANRDALKAALKDVESRAQGIARGHHMHLGALQNIDVPRQTDAAPQAFVTFPMPWYADPSRIPPIKIPNLDVHATANVTYLLKP